MLLIPLNGMNLTVLIVPNLLEFVTKEKGKACNLFKLPPKC
jgi:hypothetical protein